MKEEFKKIVEFEPAYDKRHKDPSKNYGISAMKIRFVLKGKKGATQFLLYTNWYLKNVREERYVKDRLWADPFERKYNTEPSGFDLGYHSYEPIFEGQEPITDSCEYLEGKPCYYDGSSLQAEPLADLLIEKGQEAIWDKLLETYQKTFYERAK